MTEAEKYQKMLAFIKRVFNQPCDLIAGSACTSCAAKELLLEIGVIKYAKTKRLNFIDYKDS